MVPGNPAETRKILETRLQQKPDDARTLAVLAQVDAGLGKKSDAISEARRAVELMPVSRDAYDAALVLQGLAQVYTWTGDPILVVQTLQKIMAMPGYLTRGYLTVDPAWAPLRGNKEFDTFVANLPAGAN